MRILYLLRHAKSDWKASYTHDHDRPLNKRGVRAARCVGSFLAKSPPEAVVTSSALRARLTVELAAEAGGWKPSLRVTQALYGASPETLLEQVRMESNRFQSLLLAGHEPTWSESAGLFVGQARFRFPTAALACISLPADGWDEVDFGHGTLLWFVTPKALRQAGLCDD